MPVEAVNLALTPLVSPPIPFDEALAYVTASVHEKALDHGLSLGDCACIGLALSRNVPAVTEEREWKKVNVGVKIIVIR